MSNNYFRSKRLRDFANGRECDGCCGKICAPETSVWAHSNSHSHGHGRGIKSHDAFGAVLGMHCHDFVDGRRESLPGMAYMTPAEYFAKAHDCSMLAVFRAIQDETLKL